MPGGKVKTFDDFLLNALKAAFSGTITARLYKSTSNANTLSTAGALASLTDECDDDGYPGPQALSAVTFTKSGHTVAFDSDPIEFSMDGSDVAARNIAFATSAALNGVTNPLIGTALLDGTPADVETTDGNSLIVTPDATGWISFVGASADS